MLRYLYTGVAHKSYKHVYVKVVIFFFQAWAKNPKKDICLLYTGHP